MNTTLTVGCLALLVYVATCILQWRRLTRGEKGRRGGPESSQRER